MIPVVILAAGRGTRLGPVGGVWRKALLPVGPEPLLAHHMRSFAAIGTRRFVLVVDPEGGEIERVAGLVAAELGATVAVVVQAEPHGIGHATLLARPHVGEAPFVLVLGDTYYETRDLRSAAADVASGRRSAVLSVRVVADDALIRRECTIAIDDRGTVQAIVEKPREILSRWKPCGVYFFGPRIFAALEATPPSALRGEVELTDAIQVLVERDGNVGTRETVSLDLNVTFPADILEANRMWLRSQGLDTYVHPAARVAAPADLRHAVVSAGARVGAGARLDSVVVFPDAALPAGATVEGALVVPGVGVVDVAQR